MPRHRSSRTLAGVVLVAAALTTHVARADDAEEPKQAAPPPRMYPAPLSQTTQPSYVPQSVALSGPREITNFNEEDPIPPGYRPVERMRRGPIIAGAITFGVLYAISALVAAGGDDASKNGKNELAALYVPVFGPFIQMANTDSAAGRVVCIIDGAGQTAGAALLLIGLTSPRTVLVRNDLGGVAPSGITVKPAPLLGRSGTGLALVGTF